VTSKMERDNRLPPGSEKIVRLSAKDPIKVFSKLMDMRKFYETIVQLNEAVSQKAKLEEKLIKIRVQVDMAKSVKDQLRDSKGSRERESTLREYDLSRADPNELQIVCCEAEVQSQSEQVRDSSRNQLSQLKNNGP
jgi:signal recognition particle GTPase